MTWQEALDDHNQCHYNLIVRREECGAYNLDLRVYVDTGYQYYYDAASGALVAVLSIPGPNGDVGCIAGPRTGFPLPVCPLGTNLCAGNGGPVDAAVDHTADTDAAVDHTADADAAVDHTTD